MTMGSWVALGPWPQLAHVIAFDLESYKYTHIVCIVDKELRPRKVKNEQRWQKAE